MGRRQSVDRQHVLQAAEDLVAEKGGAALTIDAVAKAANITKGGVQSCFRTKETLILAMQQRSIAAYEAQIAGTVGETSTPVERIAAHLQITRSDDEKSQARAATLLALLAQTPEHLAETRSWYHSRLKELDVGTEAGRRARLAFFATEAVFFLRHFHFLDMDDTGWNDALADIEGLLAGTFERSEESLKP